jgi:hypothetical protein
MSHVPVVVTDNPVANARSLPPMTWNGTLVNAADTATHYLHLSAFPCEKCNGPVIAGSLGTRLDDITQEVDIRSIGAACITCGFRPERITGPSVDHQFRPVPWRWKLKAHVVPATSTDDSLSSELSQDADSHR